MLKTKGILCGACTLLLLLLVAPSAFGQDQDPNLRLTFFGAGSFLKGKRTFVVGGEPFITKFASGGKAGFRVTGDVDKQWAVEGAYSFGRNNLRVFDLTDVPPERDFGVRVHQFMGNVMYYASEQKEKVRPFVTAGLELTRYSPTDKARTFALVREFVDGPAAISSSNKLGVNFGGGLEAKASDNFGVRLEFRDHVTKIPRFGVSEAFYPVSGAVHDLEASFGIVFYLK